MKSHKVCETEHGVSVTVGGIPFIYYRFFDGYLVCNKNIFPLSIYVSDNSSHSIILSLSLVLC